MQCIIEQSQAAALARTPKKIKEAKPGAIIPLTAKEREAYKIKIPLWENSDSADIDSLLEDIPEPEPKRKVIRLLWTEHNNPSHWKADRWVLDTPASRKLLEKKVKACNSTPYIESAIEWIYSIDEREVLDGEQY